jgi:hypothetical protein
MSVNVRVFVCACVYAYRACVHDCACARVYVCMRVFIPSSVRACARVYVCMRVLIPACMCVCVHACVRACVCVWARVHINMYLEATLNTTDRAMSNYPNYRQHFNEHWVLVITGTLSAYKY